MPVCKRRPHLGEILNIATDQRKKLHETKVEILERPASIWLHEASKNYEDNEDDDDDEDTIWNHPRVIELFDALIIISRLCEKFLGSFPVGIIRSVMGTLALVVMIYEVPRLDLSYAASQNSHSLFAMYAIDKTVNTWFLIESLCRLFGVIIRVKIEAAFKRKISQAHVFFHSGFVDVILTLFCYGYGLTTTGLVFRLLRLIAIISALLELFPQLDALVSGLSNGLRSILVTLVLLFFLILVYASLGHHFFAANDPLHFGTYALSVITFFQLTTFDNWSEVNTLNSFGCDSFPSEYQGTWTTAPNVTMISTAWGMFEVAQCTQPQAHPVAGKFIFVSYSIAAGYVIVNICVAAVAIGINERLQSLRKVTLYGDIGDVDAINSSAPRPGGSFSSDHPNSKKAGKNMEKLLGKKNSEKQYLVLLKKIWEGGEGMAHHATAELGRLRRGDLSDLSLSSIALDVDYLIQHNWYKVICCLWILGDVILQLYDESINTSMGAASRNSIHWMFQAGFIVDALLRFLSHANKPMDYIKNAWNRLDLAITIVNFVPLIQPSVRGLQFMCAFRFVRMARILKSLSFISDMRVVIMALSSSFVCVAYVFVLLVIFLTFFSLAGVLMFKKSAPYYFDNVGSALNSLFEVMTLDNWSDMMRKCMYGCKNFGFSTGVTEFDNSCITDGPGMGEGMGYWSPIFFIIFVILFCMVLTSLLVGVIITSMDLLREGLIEERLIWEKVDLVQRRYGFDSGTKDLLLVLFEMLDANQNATLSFDELTPILSVLEISEAKQFDFYMKVDADKSGKIDFSEFCEMIMLIGLSHSAKFNDGKNVMLKHSKKPPAVSHKHHPDPRSRKVAVEASLSRALSSFGKAITGQMDDDDPEAIKDEEQIEAAEAEILHFLTEENQVTTIDQSATLNVTASLSRSSSCVESPRLRGHEVAAVASGSKLPQVSEVENVTENAILQSHDHEDLESNQPQMPTPTKRNAQPDAPTAEAGAKVAIELHVTQEVKEHGLRSSREWVLAVSDVDDEGDKDASNRVEDARWRVHSFSETTLDNSRSECASERSPIFLRPKILENSFLLGPSSPQPAAAMNLEVISSSEELDSMV